MSFELKLSFATEADLYAAIDKLRGGERLVGAHPALGASYANGPLVSTAAEPQEETPAKKPVSRSRKAATTAESAPAATSSEGTAAATPAESATTATPTASALSTEQGDGHLQIDAFPAGGAAPIPDTDAVRKAAEELNAKHGIVKFKEVLALFGAARLSEIKEEDRAGFIAKVQGLVG